MGGSGIHPARCWAQTSPGHAREAHWDRGLQRLFAGGEWATLVTVWPSGGPASEGEGKRAPVRENENLGWDQNRRCRGRSPPYRGRTSHKIHRRRSSHETHTFPGEPPSRDRGNWPQADFPTVSASRLHVGADYVCGAFWLRRWTTPACSFPPRSAKPGLYSGMGPGERVPLPAPGLSSGVSSWRVAAFF